MRCVSMPYWSVNPLLNRFSKIFMPNSPCPGVDFSNPCRTGHGGEASRSVNFRHRTRGQGTRGVRGIPQRFGTAWARRGLVGWKGLDKGTGNQGGGRDVPHRFVTAWARCGLVGWKGAETSNLTSPLGNRAPEMPKMRIRLQKTIPGYSRRRNGSPNLRYVPAEAQMGAIPPSLPAERIPQPAGCSRRGPNGGPFPRRCRRNGSPNLRYVPAEAQTAAMTASIPLFGNAVVGGKEHDQPRFPVGSEPRPVASAAANHVLRWDRNRGRTRQPRRTTFCGRIGTAAGPAGTGEPPPSRIARFPNEASAFCTSVDRPGGCPRPATLAATDEANRAGRRRGGGCEPRLSWGWREEAGGPASRG